MTRRTRLHLLSTRRLNTQRTGESSSLPTHTRGYIAGDRNSIFDSIAAIAARRITEFDRQKANCRGWRCWAFLFTFLHVFTIYESDLGLFVDDGFSVRSANCTRGDGIAHSSACGGAHDQGIAAGRCVLRGAENWRPQLIQFAIVCTLLVTHNGQFCSNR